jgi:hypothetical protein
MGDSNKGISFITGFFILQGTFTSYYCVAKLGWYAVFKDETASVLMDLRCGAHRKMVRLESDTHRRRESS